MARNVKDIDRGFKNIVRKMNVADGSYTKVGVQQGTRHEEDLSDMVLISAVNEFGSPKKNIPARPALRNAVDRNKEKIKQMGQNLLDGVMSGRFTVRQALGLLGEYQQSLMQKSITNLRSPANSPKTAKKKGSTNPLVDTGFYQSRAIGHIEVIK